VILPAVISIVAILGLLLAAADLALQHKRARRVVQRLGGDRRLGEPSLPVPHGQRLPHLPIVSAFAWRLTRAGLEQHQRLIMPYLGGALAVSILAGLLAGLTATPVVLALFIVAPMLGLQVLQWRRMRKFIDRLPVFLERVRQLVLIGNPLEYAFLRAMTDADPICQDYFGGILIRVQHGAPFADSLDDLAIRLKVPSVYMLAACVRANKRYGGRVSNNLANLISQLNNKRRLEYEMRAATAETRTSVAILLLLTISLGAFVIFQNPSSLHFFATDPTGRILGLVIIVWPIVGLFAMRRILEVKL
jgi:tight adherence protein B